MKYKKDNGVAGLNILLSVVVLLFMIGLIIMIFSLMGAGLRDATYTSTNVTVTNETVTFTATNSVQTLATSTKRNVVCGDLTYVSNATSTGVRVLAGNFTRSGCTLINATAIFGYAGGNVWNASYTQLVSYTYVWDADNTATDVMNDTYSSLAGTTDWFDIFIVISAMVVLILLVVIIVTAIRGSGLVGDGGSRGANKVGTA